jgi:hypothetical protein
MSWLAMPAFLRPCRDDFRASLGMSNWRRNDDSKRNDRLPDAGKSLLSTTVSSDCHFAVRA